MRTPTAQELLGAWERGSSQGQVERGLELLALACPQTPSEALADLSVGNRDGLLLALRERTFGPDMTGVLACAACGETLEANFTTADLRAAAGDAEPLDIDACGYQLRLRLLTSRDLSAAAHVHPAERRQMLLNRCVVSASVGGTGATAEQLPAEVVQAVARRLAEADPQADAQLAMRCPACGHHWRTPFDILSFFWTELEAWAARALREVHVLASAYGWSERAILSINPLRRRWYLDLIGP